METDFPIITLLTLGLITGGINAVRKLQLKRKPILVKAVNSNSQKYR